MISFSAIGYSRAETVEIIEKMEAGVILKQAADLQKAVGFEPEIIGAEIVDWRIYKQNFGRYLHYANYSGQL